ncbi:MAG: hypothetical protein AAF387_10325 [Pseudomonadota bacterium]
MLELALIIVTSVTGAASGEVTSRIETPLPPNDSWVRIYEERHMDLLSVLYAYLAKTTDSEHIVRLANPEIGYTAEVEGISCRFRLIPSAGTNRAGTNVVGYYFDAQPVPQSEQTKPTETGPLEHNSFTVCNAYARTLEVLHVDQITPIQLTNVRPIGCYGIVRWLPTSRILPEASTFIRDVYPVP